MKTLLLRNATLATLVLVTGASLAQGPGRHAAGRSSPAASPSGLGYGAGYQARRVQQAEREGLSARWATTKTDDECVPATPPPTPPRAPEPARTQDPGQTPASARRDACVATKP